MRAARRVGRPLLAERRHVRCIGGGRLAAGGGKRQSDARVRPAA